ncbi:hypothetical protein D915_007853 [Fasciola hepatica]|uniref:Uncharacterized protein n=1 Tax=Fasciola hepatica TaxID=6192 RepID=A0A4E0R2H2_FASHE|nr:hypothetical protein D915_007853 [Fasciola hepatica]
MEMRLIVRLSKCRLTECCGTLNWVHYVIRLIVAELLKSTKQVVLANSRHFWTPFMHFHNSKQRPVIVSTNVLNDTKFAEENDRRHEQLFWWSHIELPRVFRYKCKRTIVAALVSASLARGQCSNHVVGQVCADWRRHSEANVFLVSTAVVRA